METRDIVHRIRKRDREALSYLFDNNAAALNGIILGILSSESLAEEALQQTFIEIWEQIDEYDESKMSLFTWMVQIARNNAIEIKGLNPDLDGQKTETVKIDSSNQAKSGTDNIEMKTLIENLDEKHRKIVDYIYLRGYNQSQTAEALQIPLDSVKTMLRDALIELRRILKDEKDLFFGALLLFMLIIEQLCL